MYQETARSPSQTIDAASKRARRSSDRRARRLENRTSIAVNSVHGEQVAELCVRKAESLEQGWAERYRAV